MTSTKPNKLYLAPSSLSVDPYSKQHSARLYEGPGWLLIKTRCPNSRTAIHRLTDDPWHNLILRAILDKVFGDQLSQSMAHSSVQAENREDWLLVSKRIERLIQFLRPQLSMRKKKVLLELPQHSIDLLVQISRHCHNNNHSLPNYFFITLFRVRPILKPKPTLFSKECKY